jgi:hypothetical protein
VNETEIWTRIIQGRTSGDEKKDACHQTWNCS